MNATSLFANVGISETYLKDLSIDVKVANELIDKRANFYKFLYPSTNMIVGDIRDTKIFKKIVDKSLENNVDFVMATPPCQGMSIAGKMKVNDIRNTLIIQAVQAIKQISPKFALIENVPTMLKAYIMVDFSLVKIVDYVKEELKDYIISFNILNTANYGVPQNRKRAIILLSKSKQWNLPIKQKIITVKDAIFHLPSLESGEKSNIKYHYAKTHNPNHICWLKHTPTGKTAFFNKLHYPKKKDGTRIKGYSTTYKRIDWDSPAPTITMSNGSISSQNNVHPGRLINVGLYSDARVLSLKEIFILTGLPENWEIPKFVSDNFARQVIGEGIPPLLVKNLVQEIL